MLVLAVGALVQATLTIGLTAWGWSVARRRGGRWWLAVWMPPGAAALMGIEVVQVGRFLLALQGLGESGAGLAAVSMAGPEVVCLLAPGVLSVALYVAAIAACSVGSLTRLPEPGRRA